jgi:hypothetical protein
VAELTEKLAAAVAGTLLRHESAIEGGIGSPRSLHVEVAIGKRGDLGEVGFYVEHRLRPSEAVGLGGTRARHP